MRRWPAILCVCALAVAGAVAVLAPGFGGHARRHHPVELAGRPGERLLMFVERNDRGGARARAPRAPCSVQGGACVKGCALPISAKPRLRAGAGSCGTGASHPCRELVAAGAQPQGRSSAGRSSAPGFCAPGGAPPSLRRAPATPRRR